MVCIWVELLSYNGRVEVGRRIRAWRNVEGVMVDRKISREPKGKILDSYVVPASTYGMETLALSARQQSNINYNIIMRAQLGKENSRCK